jgi:protein-S-isoprenylcysteine O-methyltransferase Ste14
VRTGTAAAGTVACLLPWLLTRWRSPYPWDQTGVLPLRLAGLVMLVTAVPALLAAFARFVSEGRGAPALAAPSALTERLVVGGLHRRVRNPVYVMVLAIIAGQGPLLVRPEPLLYGIAVWLACAAFVRWYEEPRLRRTYGAAYDAYRAAVPAWLPRATPWNGGGPGRV